MTPPRTTEHHDYDRGLEREIPAPPWWTLEPGFYSEDAASWARVILKRMKERRQIVEGGTFPDDEGMIRGD